MKRTIAVAVAALVLAGCGSSSGDDSASDPNEPAPSDQPPAPTSTAIPAADGIVGTRDLVTVMDTGKPVLCLGAVAESYPPQCSGPPIAGWSWKEQRGVFERSGDVRWGLFSLQGEWDGETFTVTSAVPAALYDPGPMPPQEVPADGGEPDMQVVDDLEGDPLPGTLTVVPTSAVITVDVVYDDGSIQAEADRRYGAGAVQVTSALVPIQR